MPIPRIAIVGRPNVGKSSLVNMLAGRKASIVDPTPGVTRDRVSTIIDLPDPDGRGPDKPAELVDTGGWGVYVGDGQRYDEVGADLASLTKHIEQQIAVAVSTADLILFCVDSQAGITPQDEVIAQLLREQKLGSRERGDHLVPVRVVATKVDGPKWEAHGYEIAALGFDEPLLCSAKSNYMRRELADQLYRLLPERDLTPEPPVDLKIAIVGKRNAGKSTLVNALAGEERVIVSEIAGTTRDAIDVKIEMGGRTILAIDTAGLRRKSSFQNQIEWYALERSERAIERADVVLLLIDATQPISQVDEHLAQMALERHRPVVIVINKWDLAEGSTDDHGRPATPERYEDYIRKELRALPFAPIAFMSARDGLNVAGVLELAFDLNEQARTRVGTGELNRIVRGIVEDRGPSNKLGLEARVYFATQVRTSPPTLVLVVNDPERFTHNYERYLMNRLREQLPFDEVPIHLILRSKRRVEQAAKERGKKIARTHEVNQATGEIADEISPEVLTDEALLAELPDDAAAYFDD
jgi:GTP-binding protein